MDWQAAGVVMSSGLSVAAMSWTVLGQRRSDRLAQEAGDSARRSADAADRAAAALEQMAADRGPQWRLEHLNHDAYVLTNVGQATVHHVRIDLGDLMVPEGQRLGFDHIAPESSVKFLALHMMTTRDDTVTVEWSPDEEPQQVKTWSRPIPDNPSP